MGIQRWEWSRMSEDYEEYDHGGYVRYDDHEQVVAKLKDKLATGAGIVVTAMEEITKLAIERDALRAELAASRAEVEGLKKDAERYRWLRDKAPDEWDVTRWLDNETQEVHVQDYLDEAIDAAMENGNV